MKVVDICLLPTKLIWHQRHFQLWNCVVWQICTDISECLLPPSSGWWRQQVPLRLCYTSTSLTVAGPRKQSNIIITNLRTLDLILNETQQVLEISAKIWLIWDSWFKTFAVFWMLYAFFWVIPQRLNFICQRFETLCLFHIHRQVGIKKD